MVSLSLAFQGINSMENMIQQLGCIAKELAVSEGKNTTDIPYLNIYRYHQENIILPDSLNLFILLVVNGSMRLHLSTGIKDYLPGQCLISSIDSPINGHAISACKDSPFLALSLDFSVEEVVSVLLDIESDLLDRLFEGETLSNDYSKSALEFQAIIMRLLDKSMQKDKLVFMAKHLKREIIFDLITSCNRKEFMQCFINFQQVGEIYNINSWIKQNYKKPFTVDKLAEQSNMSLSSFHQKFKTAIGMGPLQCQKKLRLLEGRRLMLNKSLSVTETAFEVGYESVSQFIRDYHRMFGQSPQKDVQAIKECFQTKS